MDTTSGWWWLSFAGAEGFRGAAVVEGDSLLAAVSSADKHECNPGGQVFGLPIPTEILGRYPETARNRLLDPAACEALGGKSLKEWEAER